MAPNWTLWTFSGDPGQDIEDWVELCGLTSQMAAKSLDSEDDKRTARMQQLKQGLGERAWEFYQTQSATDRRSYDATITNLRTKFAVE